MDPPSLHRVAAESSRIDEAALHLRRGGLVAFPTETVYGLGANAARQGAIDALYRLKQRPVDHPLIVHVAGVADASSWARLNPVALGLIGALWPGPLTLVLPRRLDSPGYACAGQKTIALRCPSHPVARALLRRFSALGGKGVAAPSANPYGRISPTDADQVEEDLKGMMELHARGRKRLDDPQIPDCWLLDGGACDAGIESTVLDVSSGEARVLRPGAIPRQQIEALLGREVPWVRSSGASPAARGARGTELPKVSGTHLAHYAPRKPLILTAGEGLAAKLAELAAQGVASVAVWGGDQGPGGAEPQPASAGAPGLVLEQHAMPASVQEVGSALYRQLRQMDQSQAQVLLVVLPAGLAAQAMSEQDSASPDLADVATNAGDAGNAGNEVQAWEAVLDRLQRAAYATAAGLVKVDTPQSKESKAGQPASTPVRLPAEKAAPSSQDAFPASATDDLDFDMSFDDLG